MRLASAPSLSLSELVKARRGFTIVELLIVVIVIAILATIVVVAYQGITENARNSALQADLSQAASKIEIFRVENSSELYPAALSEVALVAGNGKTYDYNISGDRKSFCLALDDARRSYFVTNQQLTPQPGTCDGTTGVPGDGTIDNGGGSEPTSYVVSTFAGDGSYGIGDGVGTAAQFYAPVGVAADPSGNIYVSDGANCIRKITPSAVVTTFAGTCADDGSSAGDANGTGPAAKFNNLGGLTVDSSGNVFVADASNHCVRKITPAAVVKTFAGTGGSDEYTSGFANGTGPAAKFYYPNDVAADSSGNVFVTDGSNSCVRKITPAAVVTTFAGVCNGAGESAGSADGTGPAAQFSGPYGMTADSSGNLFITDANNNCVRKVTPAAVVTTIAGTCDGSGGYADGTGPAAQFSGIWGITIDSSGNLYIVDSFNNRIRKAAPVYE